MTTNSPGTESCSAPTLDSFLRVGAKAMTQPVVHVVPAQARSSQGAVASGTIGVSGVSVVASASSGAGPAPPTAGRSGTRTST
jgi:hypothetical protein